MCRSLARRKESRKRNLAFYLPHAVPMSPSVRLLENDDSFVTLHDIYEQQCVSLGVTREEPLIQSSQKIRSVVARQGVESQDIPLVGKELTFWSNLSA
jgi:transformation/transcription domain-associated protein